MAGIAQGEALAGRLSALELGAVSSGVDPADAAYAAAATARRFRADDDRVATARLAAYFRKVLRNRLVRVRSHGEATARLVLGSVERDLRDAGKTGEALWSEIERGWSGMVPSQVLEEFRSRLCA